MSVSVAVLLLGLLYSGIVIRHCRAYVIVEDCWDPVVAELPTVDWDYR